MTISQQIEILNQAETTNELQRLFRTILLINDDFTNSQYFNLFAIHNKMKDELTNS